MSKYLNSGALVGLGTIFYIHGVMLDNFWYKGLLFALGIIAYNVAFYLAGKQNESN